MTNKISRCSICGQFLQSKKALKDHKDKNNKFKDDDDSNWNNIKSAAKSF
jgi:hypothetical protein